MAGLVPAIHEKSCCPRHLTSDSDDARRLDLHDDQPAERILYLGATADLIRRVWQHREGLVGGFTKRYGLTRLVYVERHPDISSAIRREMTMKHWPRAWKVRLILRDNPEWADLYNRLI